MPRPLHVSPAPWLVHQVVVAAAYDRLKGACPADLVVLFAPVDVQPDLETSLQPDVLVVGRSDLGGKNLKTAPLLALEVLSPSTRLYDLNTNATRPFPVSVVPARLLDGLLPG